MHALAKEYAKKLDYRTRYRRHDEPLPKIKEPKLSTIMGEKFKDDAEYESSIWKQIDAVNNDKDKLLKRLDLHKLTPG